MGKQYTIDELNNCSKETVIAIVLAMQDQLERLNQNVEYLIEQIGVMNNKQYSRSSEKLDVIDDQLSYLFNEAEALIENKYVVEPTEDEVIMVTRRKKAGKRDVDLKDLPVEEIIHKMSDEDLEKTFGPNGWKQLPDEIYKRVKVDPAVFTVQEHHVQVYAGKDNQTIVKADRPKSLLRNSIATPSLVASIMNGKYVNGMPLHRISQDYLRNDIHISKQVMANWMIQCADRYLGTLYDRLHEEMYQFHVLQADETPVKVSKDGRPANSQSYMWIYRTGKHYKDTPIILYEYQKTRKSDHPKEFLKNFKGVVVTDGYSAYKKLDKDNQDITFAGCWAHSRRRFSDAIKALPKTKKAEGKETIAYQALKQIGAIYHQDNELSQLEPLERYHLRQLTVKPLVEAFFLWARNIKSNNGLSKGKTQEGIDYCLNHEESLKVFLDDGEVPMDNNATEGALRTFCLHKHTWKLIDTIDGAKSSAIIYSITETAKANNLNPYRYLEYLLEVLKDKQDQKDRLFLDKLLPWSDELPAICLNKTAKVKS